MRTRRRIWMITVDVAKETADGWGVFGKGTRNEFKAFYWAAVERTRGKEFDERLVSEREQARVVLVVLHSTRKRSQRVT